MSEDLPDRRRHGYSELEEKLDNHAQDLEDRLQRFITKALVGFAVIGLTSALSIFGFGLVLSEQAKTSDRLAELVIENKKTADAIQRQRETSIREDCQHTNKRHDDTFAKLILLSKQDENSRKTQAGKIEVRRRRDVTLGLIEALAPKQDCEKLVRNALGKETAP